MPAATDLGNAMVGSNGLQTPGTGGDALFRVRFGPPSAPVMLWCPAC